MQPASSFVKRLVVVIVIVLVNPICYDESNISFHACSSLWIGAIVSVTPGGGTTGSIQCTVKDNNSYESSVSVDSVVAPEIKCAPFQPFLSGNLDKGIIQEHSDDPQQLSSLSNAVTPGLFADNLANSFEATEAHVKLLCIQTDLKEDSATVRCGLSKPPAYGECGGVDVTVFVSSISNTLYATFSSFT